MPETIRQRQRRRFERIMDSGSVAVSYVCPVCGGPHPKKAHGIEPADDPTLTERYELLITDPNS